ncbi:hypothetical protein C2E23DRAFT_864325 [Lenzites betulinus]|nr:hypothetical protein C2E23DRAFT_864325 [Lenzites betulinus]
MATIVADTFIADVMTAVKVAVLEETQEAFDNPTHIDRDFALARRASLKKWLKYEEPLNYGPNRIHFADLVRAVSAQQEDMVHGLPPSSTRSSSLEAFVDKIYKWAISSTVGARAPLYKQGSTGVVLRSIIEEAKRALRAHSETERESELKKAMVRAFTAKQARSLTAANARTHSERIAFELHATAQSLEDSDVRGDWTFQEISLQHIHTILNRRVTPVDWSYGTALRSAVGITRSIYAWASQRFSEDMQDWTCSLALSLAIILTKLLPNIFYPHPPKSNILSAIASAPLSKPAACIAAVRRVPLDPPSSSVKGLTNKPLYATQAAIWLLAWIDENSPLRTAIKAGNASTLKEFNSKHSHKGLNHINLIRLGIAYGNAGRLFNSARVNEDYRVRSTSDLKKWASSVRSHLTSLPEGPFNLVSAIFGLDAALKLRDKGEFPGMNPATVASLQTASAKQRSIASSSKRPLDTDLADSDTLPPRQRRRNH